MFSVTPGVLNKGIKHLFEKRICQDPDIIQVQTEGKTGSREILNRLLHYFFNMLPHRGMSADLFIDPGKLDLVLDNAGDGFAFPDIPSCRTWTDLHKSVIKIS